MILVIAVIIKVDNNVLSKPYFFAPIVIKPGATRLDSKISWLRNLNDSENSVTNKPIDTDNEMHTREVQRLLNANFDIKSLYIIQHTTDESKVIRKAK